MMRATVASTIAVRDSFVVLGTTGEPLTVDLLGLRLTPEVDERNDCAPEKCRLPACGSRERLPWLLRTHRSRAFNFKLDRVVRQPPHVELAAQITSVDLFWRRRNGRPPCG